MPSNMYPNTDSHNHNVHTSKKKMYGSLRRRIQSGMFYSTALALLILLCIFVPVIYLLAMPTSSLFSSSVTSDIFTRIDTMQMEQANNGSPTRPKGPNMDNLDKMSLSQLLLYADKMYNDKSNFDLMTTEEFAPTTIEVSSDKDKAQKMAITAILSAYDDFESRFPLRAITNQDLLLVEYADGQNNKVLCLPIDPNKLSIAQYAEDSGNNIPFVQKFYDHTKSTLTLVDSDDKIVGVITIAINPFFIFILGLAIIIILGLAYLLTLPVISLLTRFHARNILRPIDQLNKQMSALAHNDFYGINDFHFSVKRPPKELVMLMDSATQIMERMNDQNQELDAQKQELEAQNVELESQNIALTDSKETIQDQQDQLVRSEKMATLGQISAAIAHEINTPLGAIKSNAQMMQMVLESVDLSVFPPEVQKKLSKLKTMNSISNDASNRVTDIIKSLKNFSRVDQADFQDYDPIEGIESVLVLTSNLWKNKIDLIKDYQSNTHIQAYAGLLNQVVMNVIVNAIHAMPESGKLTITTQSDDQFFTTLYKDSGSGIQPEFLEKVFESGFTTKDASMGTGLGLAISKGIIDKHNGQIFAYNNVGEPGATFVVKLPLTHAQ